MAKAAEMTDVVAKGGELKPVHSTLKTLLERTDVKGRFEEMLGKKSAGFISSILSAVSTNLQLKACDPSTIISSAAIAASLDLPVNTNLGMAHLVPYSGRCQFQMGWKGFVQLAMRSGQYKTMNVAVVYEGEVFRHNRITGEMEFSDARKSNKKIGYVAYFKLLNGFEKYYYMTVEEAEAHGKRYSKSYDTGNWKRDFDAMAMKTVIKMLLSKFGILSIEMQRAIETDQAVIREDGTPEYIDVEPFQEQVEEKKGTEEIPPFAEKREEWNPPPAEQAPEEEENRNADMELQERQEAVEAIMALKDFFTRAKKVSVFKKVREKYPPSVDTMKLEDLKKLRDELKKESE